MITRRQFVATVATGVVVATGQTVQAQSGFLRWMGRWNERVDRLLLRSDHLAPELPPDETTPAQDFPSYFISAYMPIAPAGWMLKVGGLVARPTTLMKALPQGTSLVLPLWRNCWSSRIRVRWQYPFSAA